jgi:hypothetical protein
MKKILVMVGILLGLSVFAYADWIEPYGSSCKNDLYGGTITGVDVVATDDVTVTDDITCNTIAATSASYGVKISSASGSGTSVYIAGAHSTLPVGVPAGTIAVDSDDFGVYIATETTTAAGSWVLVGSQS